MLRKWRTVSIDFICNIVASFVLTGVMQILVYPFLAMFLDAQEYGTMLTIVGIGNALSITLGNTLNNLRLIMNTKYEELRCIGDFNFLLAAVTGLAVLLIAVISRIFFGQGWSIVVGVGVYVALLIFRSYHCAEFRLNLDFKKVLFGNVVAASGYAVGLLCMRFAEWWICPFVIGELFYVVYLLFKTNLYRESYGITENFPETFKKYVILILAGLAGNFLTYMDRLLVYPLLGGEAVSVYTVASMLGKCLGLILTPIAGVLLGYYTQNGFNMSRKLFWEINGVTFVLSILCLGVTVWASPYIIQVLYPRVYAQAVPYFFMANTAAVLSVMCVLTQAAVLKFAPTWIQVVKETAYAVVYVVGGIVLLKNYGLYGFCVAAILANVVRLFILYFLGNVYIAETHNSQNL